MRFVLLFLLFFPSVTYADGLAIFTATWCGPCQEYHRDLQTAPPPYRVVWIDIDQRPDLKRKYGITKVPTTLWVRDGKVVGRVTGRLRPMDLTPLHKRFFNARGYF